MLTEILKFVTVFENKLPFSMESWLWLMTKKSGVISAFSHF